MTMKSPFYLQLFFKIKICIEIEAEFDKIETHY